MKINPVETLRNLFHRGYRINFDQIDNPVEAYLFPPLEGTDAFELVKDQAQDYQKDLYLKVGKEALHYRVGRESAKSAFGVSLERGGETSRLKGESYEMTIPGRRFFGLELNGKLGESSVNLMVSSLEGGKAARSKGNLGKIFMEREIKLEPSNHPELPAYTAQGKIGGLEYREAFYRDGENAGHSRGNLGEMNIEKTMSSDYDPENHGYLTTRIAGRVGRHNFEEVLVDKTRQREE